MTSPQRAICNHHTNDDALLPWHAELRRQEGLLPCGADIAKVVGLANGPCNNFLEDGCAIWSHVGSKYGVIQRRGFEELTVLDVTHGQPHNPRCQTVGDMLESQEVFQIIIDLLDSLDEERWPISPVNGTAYAMANTGRYESKSDKELDCHGHMHVGEEATYERLVNDTITVAEETGLFDLMSAKAAEQLKQNARAKAIRKDNNFR